MSISREFSSLCFATCSMSSIESSFLQFLLLNKFAIFSLVADSFVGIGEVVVVVEVVVEVRVDVVHSDGAVTPYKYLALQEKFINIFVYLACKHNA